MKELSIEEKAKRYDEAIERAKGAHNSAKSDKENGVTDKNTEYTIQLTENIFPELKESENWIPKEIIKHLKEKGDFRSCWIAWLEKQGEQKPIVTPKFRVGDIITDGKDFPRCTIEEIDEQVYYCDYTNIDIVDADKNWKLVEHKPADKVEPKFKVSDWILIDNPCQIESIDNNGNYIVRYCDAEETHLLSRNFCDSHFHLWTIQDAKGGDVLVSSSGKPFIFKGFFDNGPMAYGGLVADDSFWPASNSNWTTVYCKPATKEQRDTLMKAMANAGYIFDFEKKELKRIEQKPTEDVNLPEFESYLCLMLQKFRTKGMCTNGEIIDFVKEHSQKLRDILAKPAWSEEDEKVIHCLEYTVRHFYEDEDTIKWCCNWLKSLRPQKKQEYIEPSWLDEANNDEELLITIEALEKAGQHDSALWVKHLADSYPQSHWKPSDEQMDALHYVTNFDYGGHKATLVSLYEQLKKLRQE